jgi:hypothetical protein
MNPPDAANQGLLAKTHEAKDHSRADDDMASRPQSVAISRAHGDTPGSR